jgi:hypothetical protein
MREILAPALIAEFIVVVFIVGAAIVIVGLAGGQI